MICNDIDRVQSTNRLTKIQYANFSIRCITLQFVHKRVAAVEK